MYLACVIDFSGYFHVYKAAIAVGNNGQNYVNKTIVVINQNSILTVWIWTPDVTLTGPCCFPQT